MRAGNVNNFKLKRREKLQAFQIHDADSFLRGSAVLAWSKHCVWQRDRRQFHWQGIACNWPADLVDFELIPEAPPFHNSSGPAAQDIRARGGQALFFEVQ
jgi:hypothetical protein